MKKITLLCGLIFLLSCSFPVFAQDGPVRGGPAAGATGATDPAVAFPPDAFWDRVSGAIQEVRFQLAPFSGRAVSSLHIRPAWLWERFEAQLDFGFYYNPWRESWQWGEPDPSLRPAVANFVESLVYHGRNYDLGYREIKDMKYGYGLLIYDYHPATPYRSIVFSAALWPGARLSLSEPAELRYFSPDTPDLTASLGTVRFETPLTLFTVPWRLGITGIREENGALIAMGRPQQAWGADLAITKYAEAVPFIEAARLDNAGSGLMAGVAGRYAVLDYLAGYFRTDGRFSPNYFGGRYEDQKRNTLAGLGDGLPDLATGPFAARAGWLGGVWLDMPGLIKAGLFYLDDAGAEQRILGASLIGEMKPLKLKYGFSNYGENGDFNWYDWYVKGSWDIWDYGYHHYYQEGESQEVFEVSVRL